MPVTLTDAQINDIYKGIDPIVIQNKAARMGLNSDYAMRIAFGRAVGSARHSYGTFYDDAGDIHHYPSHWCRLPTVPQAT